MLQDVSVLAIDQGTSATKAVVVGRDGVVLGEAVAPVQPQAGPDGAVTQDPADLLASVLSAGREAIDRAGVEVSAVGIGNQGETVLAWDRETGTPHGVALSWQDRRAQSVTAELQIAADRLRQITGLPLDPYFAAPKMTWLMRRQLPPGATVTTIDSWVTHQLTGEFVTDVATASRTLLLDLDSGEWSSEACAAFGLDPCEQPAIATNAQAIGTTRRFGGELPVTGLIVDQQAALLAQLCLRPGEMKCTYGTGAFLLGNSGPKAVRSTSGMVACAAWQLPGGPLTYCLDGQVYTAGAAVRWLVELGLLPAADALDVVADEPRPISEVPIFIPALAGLGAPDWAPAARGGWFGLSLATSRSALVDGVIWGIAAQITRLVHAMQADLDQPLRALKVDGGLTRSRRLMQAQADLLQIPVEVYPSPDATALGIAALARIGAGLSESPEQALGGWKPLACYEPRLTADEAAEFLARHADATRLVIEAGRHA